MKWIDIELKDVKVKINDQSVIDAKVDLLKQVFIPKLTKNLKDSALEMDLIILSDGLYH